MTTMALVALLAGAGAVLTWLSGRSGWLARVGPPLCFGLLVLAAWQVACIGYDIPRILLPPPSAIGSAALSHGSMLGADFVQTVLRAVVPGVLIGSSAGFLAGIALDRSDFLRRGVMPLGTLAAAMPIVGIAPIMVMWFGFDWPSKAAVVAVMTFFPMLIQVTAGLAAAGGLERDVMRSYGASYAATLLHLRLPSAVPFVFVALKLNATLALIGAIVAEFFGTPIVGMGFRISTEVARMNLDLVWAEIAVASLTGTLTVAIISVIERRLAFWHPAFRPAPA